VHEETGVLDEMVLCDSEDPSLTFHDVKGLWLSCHWQARSTFWMHTEGLREPEFGKHEL